MKKAICTFAILLYSSIISFAQSPNWLWAQSAGGSSDESGNSVAIDNNGNILVTGVFQNSITFGTINLISNGASDMFIVKYDAQGNVLWAQSAGGLSDESGNSVAIDNNGNVIVTGFYYSADITFGSTTLTNSGSSDVFIVKYNPAGNVLWANPAGGNSDEMGRSVATDAVGNIYVAGVFSSATLTFGLSGTTLANTGAQAIFIVKYNASGTLIWANREGGNSVDNCSSIATNIAGDVFVTGNFNSPTITFGTTLLTNAGGQDIFIVKYDASGNVLWARGVGGTSTDAGTSVATDSTGNVLISGNFSSGTLTFGTIVLTNPGAGSGSTFVVKYNNAGNALWAKSAVTDGQSFESHNGLATDHNGNVFETGYFQSLSLTLGTTTLINTGGADIFIVKYDASGDVLWAKSIDGSGGFPYDFSNSIAADSNGNVLVTGVFGSLSLPFGPTTLINAGNNDMFIAKLANTITGIGSLTNTNDILLYPNPALDHFVVSFKNINKKITLSVLDIDGKVIYSETALNGEAIDINTKRFSEGVYVVQIKAPDFFESKDLIIAK